MYMFNIINHLLSVPVSGCCWGPCALAFPGVHNAVTIKIKSRSLSEYFINNFGATALNAE